MRPAARPLGPEGTPVAALSVLVAALLFFLSRARRKRSYPLGPRSTPVAALLVLVAGMFALGGCTKAPPPGPKIDPSLAGFVPADTQLLVGVRWEAIEKTPVYQKYLAHRKIPQIDQFAAETGIDPTKALWELLYVSNGQRGALIGRGNFTDEGEPKLQKRGEDRFSYKGLTLIGGGLNSILLVNQTVLAAGDTDQLKAMIDAHEKSAGPPPAMAALLARMPATAQVWAADAGGSLKLPFDAGTNLGNINKIMSFIQTGTLYLDLSTGLNGVAEGTSGSDDQAEQLESGLRALIGFARLSSPANQPDMQKVWDGLRPTRENREVKLHIEEPEDLVDQLLTTLFGRLGPAK